MKLLVWAILAVTCLPFFLVGVFEAYKNWSELSNLSRAAGEIVGNNYQTTQQDGVISGAYYPVAVFSTENGERIRFTDGIGSLPPDYSVGDRIDVIYNPAEPQKARINSSKRLWLAPVLLMSVGLLPMLVAGIVLRRIDHPAFGT